MIILYVFIQIWKLHDIETNIDRHVLHLLKNTNIILIKLKWKYPSISFFILDCELLVFFLLLDFVSIVIVGIKAQNYILGLGPWLQGRINNNEDIKLRVPWVCGKWKDWGRLFEEEYLLGSAKYRPNVYSIVQSNIPVSSTNRDVHYERTRGMETRKYLRKGCYRIKYLTFWLH